MNDTHSGSCLCGEVKFEIVGNFEAFYLCHCKYCQKDTGSAHAANLFSSKAKISWVNGTDNVNTYVLPKTRHAKSYCRICGSALPNLQSNGTLLVVPAGSLDTRLEMKPSAHLYCSSRAFWDSKLEEIKKFDQLPV